MKKLSTVFIWIIIFCMLFSESAHAAESGNVYIESGTKHETDGVSYMESGTKQTPVNQSPAGINYSDIASTINEYIKEREGGLASFAVSVFDKNGIIYDGYYGHSDIEANIKADEDTVYEWGSCSKILVWVSVMQQWERGNLDLDADIREYLPDNFLTKLQYPEDLCC